MAFVLASTNQIAPIPTIEVSEGATNYGGKNYEVVRENKNWAAVCVVERVVVIW